MADSARNVGVWIVISMVLEWLPRRRIEHLADFGKRSEQRSRNIRGDAPRITVQKSPA